MIKKIVLGLLLILFFTFLYKASSYIEPFAGKINNYASAFFSLGIDVKDLIKKYTSSSNNLTSNTAVTKIKILIVPGHEPDFGGAEYKNLKERDLNLALAEKLKILLTQNPKFEVIMTRDTNGWNPVIKNYVDGNKKEIQAWVTSKKKEMDRLIDNGQVTEVKAEMGHANASTNSATLLYGVNKWAAENKVDIALHLHFNDNPKYQGKPNYAGFSIYVPEKQYVNSVPSKILAKDLMAELSKIQKVSTMKAESAGVIEDQELIAIGSHNIIDSLSILTEYAYIYEDFLQSAPSRNLFLDQAAASTAKAINNFFDSRV
ncbi:MAG: N-acetylmuramoyl-L-alanine amidase [Candidatus Vogelbacteria bacterium]|nr:N-acetylmuramoyl-L-alanine amidase [Candidatus Vogelbacteria bacterium]